MVFTRYTLYARLIICLENVDMYKFCWIYTYYLTCCNYSNVLYQFFYFPNIYPSIILAIIFIRSSDYYLTKYKKHFTFKSTSSVFNTLLEKKLLQMCSKIMKMRLNFFLHNTLVLKHSRNGSFMLENYRQFGIWNLIFLHMKLK